MPHGPDDRATMGETLLSPLRGASSNGNTGQISALKAPAARHEHCLKESV